MPGGGAARRVSESVVLIEDRWIEFAISRGPRYSRVVLLVSQMKRDFGLFGQVSILSGDSALKRTEHKEPQEFKAFRK